MAGRSQRWQHVYSLGSPPEYSSLPHWFKPDIKFNLAPGPKTDHLVPLPTICIHFNMTDQVELTRYRGDQICMRLTSTSVGDRPWRWVHTTSSSHTLPLTGCCPSLERLYMFSSVFGGPPPPGLEGGGQQGSAQKTGDHPALSCGVVQCPADWGSWLKWGRCTVLDKTSCWVGCH